MSLSEDLLHIRNKLGLDVSDIIEATKMPADIVQSIESGRILKEIDKQTTYVRSYVRSYAKSLKILDDDIILSLDQFEKNQYNGHLRKTYLADKESSSPSKSDENIPSPSKEETTKPNITSKQKPSSSSTEKKTSKDSTPPTSNQQDSSEVKDDSPSPLKTSTIAPKLSTRTSDPEVVQSFNWVDMGKKIYSPRNKRPYIIGSVVIIALLSITFLVYQYIFKSSPTPSPRNTPSTFSTPVDSSQIEENMADSTRIQPSQDSLTTRVPTLEPTQESEPEQRRPSRTFNGLFLDQDTLSVDVYASTDKLEPVRVKSDIIDKYSPYWIEKGVAMRFEFKERIAIKGQYDRMEILVNGKRLQNFMDYRNDAGDIYITREVMNMNRSLIESTTNNFGDMTPPDTVIDRPIFD